MLLMWAEWWFESYCSDCLVLISLQVGRDYRNHRGDHGTDDSSGGNLHPWSDHQCHRGPKGSGRHGSVQLVGSKHIRHYCGVRFVFLFKKSILFFSMHTVTVNMFIMLQNIYLSSKCCSFFKLSIQQKILKNKMSQFHKNIVQHNCFQHW